MRILLDTNVLSNLHTRPSLLGNQTVRKLESAKGLFFSPITFFEWLQKDDYLGTTAKMLAAATIAAGIEELPLSARAALEAQRFGSLRGSDPLDFLILSQAAQAEMDLYTSDRRLLSLGLDFVKDSTL
jgi:PIN domain nuclease of toxin-antitoxin system